MKISARNTLKGTAKRVEHGAVISEITVELPGGAAVVSINMRESAERLGLEPGNEVYAVVKASGVMNAVD